VRACVLERERGQREGGRAELRRMITGKWGKRAPLVDLAGLVVLKEGVYPSSVRSLRFGIV
jgi:hypothetical protein